MPAALLVITITCVAMERDNGQLQKSIYDLDRTSKVARAIGELAQYIVDDLDLVVSEEG